MVRCRSPVSRRTHFDRPSIRDRVRLTAIASSRSFNLWPSGDGAHIRTPVEGYEFSPDATGIRRQFFPPLPRRGSRQNVGLLGP